MNQGDDCCAEPEWDSRVFGSEADLNVMASRVNILSIFEIVSFDKKELNLTALSL
jgi:hypothetical protein